MHPILSLTTFRGPRGYAKNVELQSVYLVVRTNQSGHGVEEFSFFFLLLLLGRFWSGLRS